MKLRNIFTSLSLVLLVFASLISQAQTDSPSRVIVTSVDAIGFPNVNFSVRVQDSSGQVVTGLSPENFSVSENHTSPLTVLPRDGVMSTVFIINSHPTDVVEQNLYADIVNEFTNFAYQNGDTVAYTFTAGSSVETVNSPADVITAIDNHNFAVDGDPSSAIERAITFLTPASRNNEQVQVILIGSYMNEAVNSNTEIPVHSIQAHARGTRSQFTNNFQSIATGEFLSVQSLGSEITNFLTRLDNNRIVYDLGYVSRTAQTDMRSVTVTVIGNGGSATGILNFQADVLAPELSIISTNSGNFEIERTFETIATPSATTDGQYQFNQNIETITVQVNYPDGRSRAIEQAYLIVDGLTQPFVNPALSGDNTFTIEWDVSAFEQTQAVGVQVGITDFYSMNSTTSTQTYSIVVPDFITPEVTINPCVNPDGTLRTGADCIVAENSNLTIVFVLVLIVAIGGLVVLAVMQQRRIGVLASGAVRGVTTFAQSTFQGAASGLNKTMIAMTGAFGGNSVETQIEDSGGTFLDQNINNQPNNNAGAFVNSGNQGNQHVVTKIETGGGGGTTIIEDDFVVGGEINIPDNALAVFVVQTGQAVNGSEIHMFNPIISFGRDLAFGVDDNALIHMDGISRLHCVVNYNSHNKQFTIQDEGSSNGTTVGGMKLVSHTPTPLPDGTMIKLGKNFSMRFRQHPNLNGQGNNAPKQTNSFANASSVQLMQEDAEEVIFEETKDSYQAPQPSQPQNFNNAAPKSSYKSDDTSWLED